MGDGGRVFSFDLSSFHRIRFPGLQNLRCVAHIPNSSNFYVVGNEGTIGFRESELFELQESPTRENLRRVAFDPQTKIGLIVGNGGVVLRIREETLDAVAGSSGNNLRSVAWREKGGLALVTANRYMEEFVPAPTVYSYKAGDDSLFPVHENGSVEISVAAWRPGREEALLAGYDLVWNKSVFLRYVEGEIRPLDLSVGGYPSALSWMPDGTAAFLGTVENAGESQRGKLYLLRNNALSETLRLEDSYVCSIAWNRNETKALAVGVQNLPTYRI